MTPWERLDAELAKRRTNWTSLAEFLGTSKQAVGHWKTRGVPVARMRRAAEFVGKTRDWLEFGVLDHGDPKVVPIKAVRGRENANLNPGAQRPAIRKVRLHAKAGGTDYLTEELPDGGLRLFPEDWYSSRGYSPETLIALDVTDGSMEPNICEGDTIIVNTQKTQPKDGVIVVVSYDGEVLVRRLVHEAPNWWLASDSHNQLRFPRKVYDKDHTEIIGHTVYRLTEHIG